MENQASKSFNLSTYKSVETSFVKLAEAKDYVCFSSEVIDSLRTEIGILCTRLESLKYDLAKAKTDVEVSLEALMQERSETVKNLLDVKYKLQSGLQTMEEDMDKKGPLT